METSQQLFGDSFSYGWLMNIKPSFESLNSSFRHSFDGSSFIEMDPDLFSMRWTNDAHDFNFNLPSSQSQVLVHADQIFSNGLLLPLHLNNPPQSEVGYESFGSNFSRSKSLDSSKALLSQSNRFQSRYFYTVQSRPASSNSSPLFHSAESTPISLSSCSSKSAASRSGKFKPPFFRNCTKSPKKILWKYLFFLMPLYKKVRGLSLTSPKTVTSCRDSVGNSPGMTTAFSSIEWCRGNADSSIYDAILHCKKSIVKSTNTLTIIGLFPCCFLFQSSYMHAILGWNFIGFAYDFSYCFLSSIRDRLHKGGNRAWLERKTRRKEESYKNGNAEQSVLVLTSHVKSQKGSVDVELLRKEKKASCILFFRKVLSKRKNLSFKIDCFTFDSGLRYSSRHAI